MIIWALKNCDTCRKALKYCDENGILYDIKDVREDNLDETTIKKIVAAIGVDGAVNKRSTTWRNLPVEKRETLDEIRAITLLKDHPTVMKRPVFIKENNILSGFNEATKARLTD